MGAPCESSGSITDFDELNLLGEGAYSAVFKVQRKADGQTYAMKKVKMPSLTDKEKQNALNEIRLLASVRHENIISYKEAFFDDKTRCLCIVTECADGGDLMAQITRNQKKRTHLKEEDAWRYFIGLTNGLKALHSIRILHRDMKPANVFLHGSVVKLGDFNVSTVNKRGLCMTQTGTPYYASPEVWRDMPYDAKSDIWSLGCVMFECLALQPPFQAKDMEGLYRAVLRGKYPKIPDCYSKDLFDVISFCLQVNPRNRPSAEQLLQLPIMRRKASELGLAEADHGGHASDLLQTIKVPRNIMNLQAHLPRPQYGDAPPSAAPSLRTGGYSGGRHGSGLGLQEEEEGGWDTRDGQQNHSAEDHAGGDSLDACVRKARATPPLLPPLVDMLPPEPRPARGGRHGAGSQPPPRRKRSSREGRRDRSSRRGESQNSGHETRGRESRGHESRGGESGDSGGGGAARERRYVASLSPYVAEVGDVPAKHQAASDPVPRLPRILSSPASMLM